MIASRSAGPAFRLSKSKFVAGAQCLKRLYFEVHHPELAGEKDEGQRARLEQGQEVGTLAQRAFPGGVLVDYEPSRLDEALARTEALVQDCSVPAVFEATFRHSNILVRVDILDRRRRNRWRLIEVKSSVAVKDYHICDVAIQDHVLAGAGLDVSSVSLMHLNRDYVYDGDVHDTEELFGIEDLTSEARKFGLGIPSMLKAQQETLARGSPPDVEPGPQCCDPYDCEFSGYCNPPLPENHVAFIPRLSERKRQELYDLGVTLINEIPDEFPLTETQSRVCDAVKTGRPWTSSMLTRELSGLKYPLYFMDFESLFPAIPRLKGMWPYSHIPFQWSVHRMMAPHSEAEHFEFLADDDRDPRREFIGSLVEALGRRGPIIVYNKSFESQRLADLAKWLPNLDGRIAAIQERLWDLLPFIRKHLYHPQFHGSFSLKAVLPALAPELTYEGMDVADGGEAGLAWDRMIRGGVDPVERLRIETALRAYCRQDTLAMVRVLKYLRTVR